MPLCSLMFLLIFVVLLTIICSWKGGERVILVSWNGYKPKKGVATTMVRVVRRTVVNQIPKMVWVQTGAMEVFLPEFCDTYNDNNLPFENLPLNALAITDKNYYKYSFTLTC